MSAQYDALSQWSWRVIVSLIGISGHSCKNQERAHLVLALPHPPHTPQAKQFWLPRYRTLILNWNLLSCLKRHTLFGRW